MGLSLKIAMRYLFAKKSHNIINIISLISAIGITIGSMALIIILSGFNGFDSIIKRTYESYEADFVVSPKTGKKFKNVNEIVAKFSPYGNITPVIDEKVFVVYNGNQGVAHMRGIKLNQEEFRMSNHLIEGEFKLNFGEIPQVVVGTALAYSMGIRTRFINKLNVYFPDKTVDVKRNLSSIVLNPEQALNNINFPVAGILDLQKNFDDNLFYVSFEQAKKLAGYAENEASFVEIYLTDNNKQNVSKIEKNVRAAMNGLDVIVKNQYEQNAQMYKIMKIEKFVVFLILFFVVMIISVNIFSSLAMLMIDKSDDIAIMQSMGATVGTIRRIFILQGWLISFFGAVCGVFIGLVVCWLQIKFGLVAIPGNYITEVFPVKVQLLDVLLVLFGVIAAGYLIALIPARKIKEI